VLNRFLQTSLPQPLLSSFWYILSNIKIRIAV
jgi:hypothetical protein